MINSILKFSIKQRGLILLVILGVGLLGVFNFLRLPIDAVPDITNVQVQINTEAQGYTPLEVEQRITYPVEVAMSGIPHLEYTRSISRYGLSQVTVVFKDGTDIYFARQQILERLQTISDALPVNISPKMGPISSGLGEIYMYKLVSDGKPAVSALKLRTIQDWVVKPQLRNVPGVAEVNAIGGYTKTYQVSPIPTQLVKFQLTLEDVEKALKLSNENVGAGYIEKNGQQYLIRVPGQLKTIHAINEVVISTREGVPIKISDVANVMISHEQRFGAGVADGKEAIIGTVAMLMGENSRIVSEDVHKKIQEIKRSLPKGVSLETAYNRTSLVNATIKTVSKNLIEGAILVVVILFLFLGNIRAAIITALIIPFSMLMTITGMVQNKISANLMSLGALDFGLIVDGAVIIVENCIKQFSHHTKLNNQPLTIPEKLELAFTSTKEVIKPSVFGVIIITIVYLPILTLSGVEGKMFIPMAKTVILALISSIILCFTFVPAACALFLSRNISEKENVIILLIRRIYKPILFSCLRFRGVLLGLASLLFVFSFWVASQLGGEFIPSLDEGDIALHAMRIPGTSLTQAISMQESLEKRLMNIKEVSHVFSKIGTAEVATDPMPPNVADTFVILKPHAQWPNPNKSKQELIRQIQADISQEIGNNYEFTQPIQMRFNELISGVRADVAVKLFGDDMNVLLSNANKILSVLKNVNGSADARVEQVSGLPTITVDVNREHLALYGLKMASIQEAIKTAINGQVVGDIFEGDKRFSLVVRLEDQFRKDPNVLRSIFIELPSKNDGIKHFVPLNEVASFKISSGPNQISRENGKRRVVITANVRGRDLSGFVTELKGAIADDIKLPSGYWVTYGGQFEQLQSATNTLLVVVPITLLLILLLLYMALGSKKDALIVFSGIPFALTGGVLSLWFRGIPLSISAGVGFIALSGVAVLNGLVLVTFITKLKQSSNWVSYSIVYGALSRLRPVLMTALVAALGFVPMAIATGTGAEVQRPLATVVIGGIISSTILTLLVLPGVYSLVYSSKKKKNAST